MIETLIVIGGAIGVALVGFFVFTRDTRRWSNRLYGMLSLSFIVLMTANLFTFGQFINPDTLVWAIRAVAFATTLVMACVYFLTQALAFESRTTHFRRSVNKAIFWVSPVVALFTLTPFVFESAKVDELGAVVPVVAWGIVVFAAYSLTILLLTVTHLVKGNRAKYSKKRRAQDRSILIGILPTLLVAPVTSFILPVIYGYTEFVALTPVYVLFFVSMVAYAMIRHGLFDIRLAAVRTVAYAATVVSLAGLYSALVYLLSELVLGNRASETAALMNPVTISAALIIAFAFQPIKRIFNRLTDRLFYKDNYSISQFITRLTRTLNSTNDLRSLLERTAREIASTLKTDHAFFFVHLPDGRYMTAGTAGHNRIAPPEFKAYEQHMKDGSDILLASQLKLDDGARRMMVSHRIELLMPLYKNGAIVGYLCLGDPKNSGFTNRDIRALRTLADELTIAIQNALSVEEVKKLNDTLEQRISTATKELRMSNKQLQRLDEAKDEFISMASHQLRTPLTSIKGYISMMLEGDMGKITKEQERVLEEAFMSSERMVRLIGDFLNVSRLQTGKFVIEKHPVDLQRLVRRELEGLEQNATARDLKFIFESPAKVPILDIDESKIQQVVMNFCDNAIYYSKEGSSIRVTLKEVDGFVEFKVIDKGIGVPEAEQVQLFNKFFRATNARRARPDGTGVGLFLAKKVVNDHDGSIIFESKEGKGSTFGFRLPVPMKNNQVF